MIGRGKFGKKGVPVQTPRTKFIKVGTGAVKRLVFDDISPRPDFCGGFEQPTDSWLMDLN